MIARILKKGEESITINQLMDEVKKSPRIAECGALFSFEGIVREKEPGKNTEKMDLTTPDIKETESELEKIIRNVKNKYGVIEVAVVHYVGKFQPSDPLFLVVVAGSHRQETRSALNEVVEKVKYELDFKKEEHTADGTNIIMSGG
jgi:molybdopterin synthase catalytic subunit